MTAIVVPTTENYEWRRIRKGLGLVLEAAAPLAQVHREWKLEFDPQTSLGKVTSLLKGLNVPEAGDHSQFVHCWMIGLLADTPITTDFGDDTYVGGNTSEYFLTFAVWGLFDYKGWRSSFADASDLIVSDETDANASGEKENAMAAAENEHRRVKAFIRANPQLTLDDGRAHAQAFGMESMDIHGFSGGNRIIVVQGSLRVRVRESFT